MRPSRRFLLSGLAVAAAELVLALLMAGTVLGPYFAACAGLTVAVAVAGSRLLSPGPRRDPPGGGGPGAEPCGPEPEPWWPALEDLEGDVGDAGDVQEDVRVPVPG